MGKQTFLLVLQLWLLLNSVTLIKGISITDCTSLQSITSDFSGGTNTNSYLLAGDIDCSGIPNFVPIGNGQTFGGIFDGGNFKISNLVIYHPGSNQVGLFSYAKNATIQNLKLQNVSVTGVVLVGAIAGVIEDTDIFNVHLTGSPGVYNQIIGIDVMGAFAGYYKLRSTDPNSRSVAYFSQSGVAYTNITGTAQVGDVFFNNMYIGTQGQATVYFTQIYATSTVTSFSTGYAGGGLAVQLFAANSSQIYITDSYMSATIIAPSFAAGFFGALYDCDTTAVTLVFNNTFVNANIVATSGSGFGAYIGNNNWDSSHTIEFYNSFYDNSVVSHPALASTGSANIVGSVMGLNTSALLSQVDTSFDQIKIWCDEDLRIRPNGCSVPVSVITPSTFAVVKFAAGTNCSHDILTMFSTAQCHNFSNCLPIPGSSGGDCVVTATCLVINGAAYVTLASNSTHGLFLEGTSALTQIDSLICEGGIYCGFASRPSQGNGFECVSDVCGTSYIDPCLTETGIANIPATATSFVLYSSQDSLPASFGCADSNMCCSYVHCSSSTIWMENVTDPIALFTFENATCTPDIKEMFVGAQCHEYGDCLPSPGYTGSDCQVLASCSVQSGNAVVSVALRNSSMTGLFLDGFTSPSLLSYLNCSSGSHCGFATPPNPIQGFVCLEDACSNSTFVSSCSTPASQTNIPSLSSPYLFYWTQSPLSSTFGCVSSLMCCNYVFCSTSTIVVVA